MQDNSKHIPELGFGLGLRPKHYPHIFEYWPDVDWFEIISENFMDTGGKPRRNLARVAERYPIVMHGVALSIGTVDPLNSEYLQKLKKLASQIKPAWISDHLCWTGIAHKNSHDLLPVPYTEEALKHIVSRIKQVQDFLERPLVLENPSTYLEFRSSNIPEAEFIARMAQDSGCQLLLDVNNVYVTCYNHRLDAKAYIDALPLNQVAQIHLSGHSNMGTHIIDTHDDHVVDEVWALYSYAINKAGRIINTMVEWDDKLPEFEVLNAELGKARAAAKDVHNNGALPQLFQEQPPYLANITTPLNESQFQMQEAILSGTDSNAAEWIRCKEQFPATDQLAVYINAYRYRLYAVTAEEYPVLKNYLGDEAFDELIKNFINSTPSGHFNIGRYSALLPGFLKGDEFAIELATLENAVTQLTDLEETKPLESQHLEGLTPETLMEMSLHPRKALQLFEFNNQVNRYFISVMEEGAPSAPISEKSYLAVFRHEDVVWRMDLSRNEYQLLQKLFSGMPIGRALGQIQEEFKIPENKLATNLSEWFSRWIRNGLLRYEETIKPQRKTA